MRLRERSGSTGLAGWLAAAGLAGVGSLAAVAVDRGRKLRKVAPELRSVALVAIPPMLPALVPLMQRATRRMRPPAPPGVRMSEEYIQVDGGRTVRVLRLERQSRQEPGSAPGPGPRPAMVWLHGGGYLIGAPEIDLALLARVLASVDVTIFSVDYRLAPQDPFPAAFDDAAAALRWVIDNAAMLGVDPDRIAVGGNSAGGGLAAALAQWACDQGIRLVFQLLMYPMLDDRTACRADHDGRGELVWTPRNNRYGWASYLGHAPGAAHTADYAVPGRREKLVGLPPAWIGVGALDLFHDEDVAYAERLRAAGVTCGLDVVADAPHGFDLFAFDTTTAQGFHADMAAALCGSLTGSSANSDRRDG